MLSRIITIMISEDDREKAEALYKDIYEYSKAAVWFSKEPEKALRNKYGEVVEDFLKAADKRHLEVTKAILALKLKDTEGPDGPFFSVDVYSARIENDLAVYILQLFMRVVAMATDGTSIRVEAADGDKAWTVSEDKIALCGKTEEDSEISEETTEPVLGLFSFMWELVDDTSYANVNEPLPTIATKTPLDIAKHVAMCLFMKDRDAFVETLTDTEYDDENNIITFPSTDFGNLLELVCSTMLL